MFDFDMMDKNNFVKRNEFMNWFVNNLTSDDIFTLNYIRVNPKCLHCNKSNADWKGLEYCPKCNKKLQTDKTANCSWTIRTNINGHLFNHYEIAIGNRSCRINNILMVSYRNKNFFLV
jgi:hypothetical protein